MRQVFHEVIDFVTIDAPFECREDPPQELKRFLAKGRKKFRSWLKFPSWEEDLGLGPNEVCGLEEAVDHLISALKTQGPFDGVLGFSQGGIIFRHFYRITQEIDPDSFVSPADRSK